MPIEENTPLYDVLSSITKSQRTRSYLEIGVRDGDSLTAALKNRTIERLVLCDTWGDMYGGTNKGSHKHIEPIIAGVKSVCFLDGDSKVLIPTLAETFDLINIDGDHSMLGCLTDMKNCWPLLVPGGFMVVDDLAHPAHKYLDACFTGFAIEASAIIRLRDIKTGHGVGVLQKKETQ